MTRDSHGYFFRNSSANHIPYGTPAKVMKNLLGNTGCFARFLPGLVKLFNPIGAVSHAGFLGNIQVSGETPIAPSSIKGLANEPRKEMTVEDIQGIIEAFAAAAGRARAAGFDGVQMPPAYGAVLDLRNRKVKDFSE
jgi:hypothetical protein